MTLYDKLKPEIKDKLEAQANNILHYRVYL